MRIVIIQTFLISTNFGLNRRQPIWTKIVLKRLYDDPINLINNFTICDIFILILVKLFFGNSIQHQENINTNLYFANAVLFSKSSKSIRSSQSLFIVNFVMFSNPKNICQKSLKQIILDRTRGADLAFARVSATLLLMHIISTFHSPSTMCHIFINERMFLKSYASEYR